MYYNEPYSLVPIYVHTIWYIPHDTVIIYKVSKR